MSVLKSLTAIAIATTFATPTLAASGFVALEGSDATALHHDASYTPQLFKYLQGASSKDVLIYDPSGTISLAGITGGVGATYTTTLTGKTLGDFSAIYIESPGGCCSADNTVLNGFGASVAAFIAAGGNLSIENYNGGTYDGVVVGGAAPDGTIQGVGAMNGGIGGGPGCTDGETVTAFGMSKGFSQPPVDGCWSHQGYESKYWEGLGYASIMKSSTEFTYRGGSNDGSSFLALGGTLGGGSTTPEPETWALMLAGFGLVGAAMRRRVKNVTFA